MGGVFISYRRSETASEAVTLYRQLAQLFGSDHVFMDSRVIQPGNSLPETIREHLASCSVLVALIGREWISVRDRHGRRRLDDPNDYIRLEIRTALARNVLVVPVLVQGATIPSAEDLPEELAPLVHRLALELGPISDPHWDYDFERLVDALSPVMPARLEQPSSARWPGAQDPGSRFPLPGPSASPRGRSDWLTWRRWRRPAWRLDATKRLDQAAADLAYVAERRWEAEANRQQLTSPPIKVAWSAASPDVAADLRDVLTPRAPGNGQHHPESDLLGSWDTAARTFVERIGRGIPRLVILGQSGAGKTVLALTLQRQLLRLHKGAHLVPVLLPVASWDPEEEELHLWAATRLTEIYPEVPQLGRAVGPGSGSPTIAQELLRSDRVLLVLDGLDQMPEKLRPAAIRALNSKRMPDHPLVLTCRLDAYRDAVGAGGKSSGGQIRDVLARAAVIELHRLSPGQLEPYLLSAAPDRKGQESRWRPVLRRLEQDPGGPFATALSTPLMAWLARTVYEADDPARLLDFDTGHPGDRDSLEGHLLDELIPSRYAERVTRDDGLRPWTADEAKRWLTFLARQLDGRKLGDSPGELAWWHLADAAPLVGRMSGALAGILVGLVIGLSLWRLSEKPLGLLAGVAYGIPFAVESARSKLPPARVQIRVRGRLGQAVMAGLTIGVAGLLTGGVTEDWSVGLVIGLAVGFPTGFAYGLAGPADIERAASPRSVLQRDRGFGLVFGAMYGVIFGFIGGLMPDGSLAFGLVFGVVTALSGGITYGPVWVLVFKVFRREGLQAKMGVCAWFRFFLACGWFMGRRQLPCRVMTFLDDACARQVLRQVGAVYQFRHERLRARLAGQSTTSLAPERWAEVELKAEVAS